MTNSPKNQPTFHINSVGNLNTGDVTIQGDQIGIQHDATDPEIKQAIADLQTLIAQLQTQYPHIATETEALAILDVEFTEIKRDKTHKLATLRKQLLNPDRHLQATKATLIEVAKSACDKSLIVKAIITYLDKLSEEPNHGA